MPKTNDNAVGRRISADEDRILRHALGMQMYTPKSRWGYRNHYACCSSDAKANVISGLVRQGLMEKIKSPSFASDYEYYRATIKGATLVGLHRAGMIRAKLITTQGRPRT